jgi:hypothetical protein
MHTKKDFRLSLSTLMGLAAFLSCAESESAQNPYSAVYSVSSQSADYCQIPDIISDVIERRPGPDEDPIDDVNWFARPVAHSGRDHLVAFASHNQNYLYNLTNGVRVQIPDRSDAVATPDGRYMTVPSSYTSDSTVRFYPVAPMLEHLARGEDALDIEAAFIHDHPEMTQTYYQSTALLSVDTVEATIETTYRLMFSGTSNQSQFRIADYHFSHRLSDQGLTGVRASEPMRLCAEITNDFNTPFISKDGRYVAAYSSTNRERAHSPGASLKIFEITATDPAQATASCREVLDFGITAGKADFSFDGRMLTFHISQGAYLTPFVNGGLPTSTITDVVVAELIYNEAGDITGHKGLQRLTTSVEAGVGSYFPAFFPDGNLFYIANEVPRESEEEKRFHFRVVNPAARPPSKGTFETEEQQAQWQILGAHWQQACEIDLTETPTTAHEAPWLGLSLNSKQCHALVDDARAAAEASAGTDWDAMETLCPPPSS